MREARMSEFFSFATLLTKPLIHSLTNFGENGAPTRSCTRLACLPSRRIAENALEAFQMQSEECRVQNGGHLGCSVCFHSQFCILHLNTGGSAIPREPRAGQSGWICGVVDCWVEHAMGSAIIQQSISPPPKSELASLTGFAPAYAQKLRRAGR